MTNFSNAQFGQISSLNNTPRQLQFAAKLLTEAGVLAEPSRFLEKIVHKILDDQEILK
ncbi:hypothetical protein [Terriglobus sp. RCC_193]|uniref:hypothetical protein n=1 Tax=Terriglobus sp. RCC_193 TaxID=3239218 RepID=UPI0035244CB4